MTDNLPGKEVIVTQKFPSEEWLDAFCQKLNRDERYGDIAKNWEGDIQFTLEFEGGEEIIMYLDLWHGTCRKVRYIEGDGVLEEQPAFTLEAPVENFQRILEGELDPMQAMLTRRLKVKGNMAYILRNIPVVLDFVRCAKTV